MCKTISINKKNRFSRSFSEKCSLSKRVLEMVKYCKKKDKTFENLGLNRKYLKLFLKIDFIDRNQKSFHDQKDSKLNFKYYRLLKFRKSPILKLYIRWSAIGAPLQ